MSADTIIAVCALIVSVVATALAIWSAVAQRHHMKLSVRPIAAIPVADFEDRVGVFLTNKGLGPMKIDKMVVRSKSGICHDSVVAHMHPLPDRIVWKNVYDSVDGAVLQQDHRLDLLILQGDPSDPPFCQAKREVRNTLKDLTVQITYRDLYDTPMAPFERSLSFFGRHSSD